MNDTYYMPKETYVISGKIDCPSCNEPIYFNQLYVNETVTRLCTYCGKEVGLTVKQEGDAITPKIVSNKSNEERTQIVSNKSNEERTQ